MLITIGQMMLLLSSLGLMGAWASGYKPAGYVFFWMWCYSLLFLAFYWAQNPILQTLMIVFAVSLLAFTEELILLLKKVSLL